MSCRYKYYKCQPPLLRSTRSCQSASRVHYHSSTIMPLPPVDTEFCDLEEVSNRRVFITMKTNVEWIEFLLQNVLLVTVIALLVLCFPPTQTLLLVALLPVLYPRLQSGTLAQIALVARNARVSAVYGYYISVMSTNYIQAIQVQRNSDGVPTSYAVLSDVESCRTSIKCVTGISHPPTDDKQKLAHEHSTRHMPDSEYQVVKPPSSLKQLRLGLCNVASPIKEDSETNGKAHKRTGAKHNVRCHVKEDKENESPGSNEVTGFARRNGLKPLTLALTNPLPSRQNCHISGSKPTLPRDKGAKRLSSVFYVSGEHQEAPSTFREAASKQNGIMETPLLRQIDDLSGKLDEERKLVAKLHAEMENLECQARVRDHEVFHCQQEAIELQATIEARGFIIRVLCANIAVLQQREVAWNQASWLNLYQKLTSEMRWEEQYKCAEQQICKLVRQVAMGELGHRWIFTRFKEQLRIEMGGTSLESSKSSRIVSEVPRFGMPCTTPSIRNMAVESNDLGPIELRGESPLDDTLEPTHGPEIRSSEKAFAAPGPDSSTLEIRIGDVGFVSSGPLPIPAAAPSAASPQYSIIYEVDGRSPTAPRSMEQLGATLPTANHAVTVVDGAKCVYPGQDARQTYIVDYCLQRDSPFYSVPQSAFVLPLDRDTASESS